MNIRHLKHSQIDFQAWDECVNQSKNGLIYAFSWYLDAVCPNWEALVEGDYQTIMPLTIGKKYGLKYLYQPLLTQQLGVFSKSDLSSDKVNEFIEFCAAKFKFVEINLNQFNVIENTNFEIHSRINQQIDISKPYENLYLNYRRNTKQSLKKAAQLDVRLDSNVGISELMVLFRENVGYKVDRFFEKHYQLLEKIVSTAINNGTGSIRGAYNANNELCAVGFFLTALQKTFLLVCASTPEGKKNQAMYLMIDRLIQERAQKDTIFDFEGSSNQGIGFFNEGFGAEKHYYFHLKRNQLPWWIKLIKN